MKTTTTPAKRRISADDALALWREYKATGDQQVRNRLVMTYAPLVKYIVFKKVRELPARCEVEDFISCGLEALIASIDRYDPDKGATLEQFAWTRIHGAVLDELRRQDWAPRSLRRWERDIHKAREQFSTLHGRRPSREELAEMLAISVEELRRRQDDIAVSDVTSLNTLVISDDETTVERIDTLADTDTRQDPEQAAARSPGQGQVPSRVREPPQARARGRRAALRQEPHAARDRRHPRRVREPRLPDPLAAEAHAQAAAVRGRPSVQLGGVALKRTGFRPMTKAVTMAFDLGNDAAERHEPAPTVPARGRHPGGPPARVLAEVDAAFAHAERLHAAGRELHFGHDPMTHALVIQLRTLHGRVLETLRPSAALDFITTGAH